MRLIFPKSKKFVCLAGVLASFFICNIALADSFLIKCKTHDGKNFRIWKFNEVQNVTKFWTFNEDKFYPFCTQGLSLEFPSGLLCAFKKDRQVGTVATYIDIKRAEITDILIREDTVLENPSTWTQMKITPCRLIRQ